MLPARHRLTRRQDFADTLRRGPGNSRAANRLLVLHVAPAAPGALPAVESVRVGFSVSRAVGGAVVRNQVKRRLRALTPQVWAGLPAGSRVVVRALPDAAAAPFPQLRAAYAKAIADAMVRRSS